MLENNSKDGFSYSYSAKEQEEIKKIREKYVTNDSKQEESKIERIRSLDAGVTRKGTIVSLIVGIIGTIIMGVGMSLVMTDFAKILGNYSNFAMPVGIIIGLVGIVGIALAYPIYCGISKRERERIAPEIIRLTDELMK